MSGSPGTGRGTRVARLAVWLVVIAVAVVVLFTWVFPWVESVQQDPTLGADAAGGAVQVVRSPR